MNSDTCLSSFGARLFVVAPLGALVSWFPSLCCAESEDYIDGEFNSDNSLQLRLCFLFSAFRFIFSSRPDVLHTVPNSVQVQTVPTVQAAPVLTDSFSRGHDPYAHACEPRLLTIVGWTSLRVKKIDLLRQVAYVLPCSSTPAGVSKSS